jgi:hypothetical protein
MKLDRSVSRSNTRHYQLAKKASGKNDKLKHDYHLNIFGLQQTNNVVFAKDERKEYFKYLKDQYTQNNTLKFPKWENTLAYELTNKQ